MPVKRSKKLENNEKFKIEFNKELNVRQSTTLDGEEKKDKTVFLFPTSFLRFNDDRIEFQFKINNSRWSSLEILSKSIHFDSTNVKAKKLSHNLKIETYEAKRGSDFTTVMIHATFKDVLLKLFSPHPKEFKLKLNYKLENLSDRYKTVFHVLVPVIEQKEWYARVSGTGIYRPEEVCGSEMVRLFKNNFKLRHDSKEKEKDLLAELLDYVSASTISKFKEFDPLETMKQMLVIEDLRTEKSMETYSVTHQYVNHFNSCRIDIRETIKKQLKLIMCEKKMQTFLYDLFVIDINKKLPNDIMEFDHMYLTDMLDYQTFWDDLHEIKENRVVGKIEYIFGNLILFRRQPRQPAKLEEYRPYHIQFLPNRISVRVAHRAIEDAGKKRLSYYLRDFGDLNNKPVNNLAVTNFKWMNSSINRQQQKAIKNIFNRSSFPAPYIVFGPPGTGKSSTIIEAVAQIVKLQPLAHILITAKSNSACDDVGRRLLSYVSCNKILRLYSPAFDKKPEKIEKVLEPISNFRERQICRCGKRSCPEREPTNDPTYEEVYTARVIISTLVSCGRIVSAGVKSDHFDYIFIDEAASESEPYTLIPISGLGLAANGKISAQIVLSGDHKQLGAIVRDSFCRKLGMEKSMQERIMETNQRYQKAPDYDQRFVTLLVNNYRSHAAILQFSNENFYDNQLVAKCQTKIANFACEWEFLRNKKFPLVFHTTRTASKEVGLSLMNEGEVNVVNAYITALMLGVNGIKVEQSDIGIITPYRAQRDRLDEQFGTIYPKIEIGTVDAFQGREKKVIILSTVRSRTRHVGFLRNEKRLNVALTRAQSLLIIVGNSATLQKCLIWNKFVAYCYNNQAIVGDNLAIDHDVVNDENYEGAEEKPDGVDDEYDD